jgi:TonB family protein
LLLAAFAVSLLIHVVWALIVRRPQAPVETQVETVTIRHRLVLTKMATPPPLPKRTPVPHPAPTSRPAPHATHATVSTGAQGGTGRATAAPTQEPTPAPTVAAVSCAKNDIDAVVTSTPAPPDIPVAARSEGTSGTTLVDVKLDAQGAVTGAAVSQSSGNPSLDVVAVGMARAATYSPATHDCKPVASTYTFSVKFVAW